MQEVAVPNLYNKYLLNMFSISGARLGILQVKLGVAEIIRNYEVSLSPKVAEPLEYDRFTFATKFTEIILLRLKKINY